MVVYLKTRMTVRLLVLCRSGPVAVRDVVMEIWPHTPSR